MAKKTYKGPHNKPTERVFNLMHDGVDEITGEVKHLSVTYHPSLVDALKQIRVNQMRNVGSIPLTKIKGYLLNKGHEISITSDTSPEILEWWHRWLRNLILWIGF